MIAKAFIALGSAFFVCVPGHSYGDTTTVVNVTCGLGLRGTSVETCENAIRAYRQELVLDSSLRAEKESPMSNPQFYATTRHKLERDIANAYAVIKLLRAGSSAQ